MAFRLSDVTAQRLNFMPQKNNGHVLAVPHDYQSIQAALEKAKAGDIIQIYPGKYVERIQLPDQVHLEGVGINACIEIEQIVVSGIGLLQGVSINECILQNGASRQAKELSVRKLITEEKSMLSLENSNVDLLIAKGDGFLDNNEIEDVSQFSSRWIVEKCSFVGLVSCQQALVLFDNCKFTSDGDLLSVDKESEVHLLRCTFIGKGKIKVGEGNTFRFGCVSLSKALILEGGENVVLPEV